MCNYKKIDRIIYSEEDLKLFINEYRKPSSKKLLFRGHTDKNYKLMPTAGRDHNRVENYLKYEKELINILRNRLVKDRHNTVGSFDILNDDHILAYAQHYGFATRFLDWTWSIDVAIGFAFRNSNNSSDKAIWILQTKGNPRFCSENNKSKNIIFNLEPTNKNQAVQQGIFVRHVIKNESNKFLNYESLMTQYEKYLKKVIIKNNVEIPSNICFNFDDIHNIDSDLKCKMNKLKEKYNISTKP